MATARRIKAENWLPIGVAALEANALLVVRSDDNRSIIAGPGAGKTELLAQRAAFLLQTGAAPEPQRILAISYKRDAAANLAARVRQRCHTSHAARLDSMTFDAFAKGIVDRFGQALPKRWRPSPDYQLMFPNERVYREFLTRELDEPPRLVGTGADIQAISTKSFERDFLLGAPLPERGWAAPSPGEWAASEFWRRSIRGGKATRLSFAMLGRLAELVLRTNPMARDALRLSYSHLFMDEFQDTTQVQYDLVRTIFLGSDTVMTAVGDNKQQIMRWALAMDDPFNAFDSDFGAVRTPLFNNYRSSPALVAIQHVLAQALDAHAVVPVSQAGGTISGESCAIWDFSSARAEANALADFVASEMSQHSLGPRDFVLLVRQKAVDYAPLLEHAFAEAGLTLRNEAEMVGEVALQDLLADDLSGMIVSMLRLAMSARAGRHWGDCQEIVARLHGLDPEDVDGQARLSSVLDAFVLALGRDFPVIPPSPSAAQGLVDRIVDFFGRERLVGLYPAYGQGRWLEKLAEAVAMHLLASAVSAGEWGEALDCYEGLNSVPLMTIHKSKGLEYHSVIFVGLDDGAWWSFDKDRIEATATFFVAFTRAKQRVLFTYCARRGQRHRIATLYELLATAGVEISHIA